LTGKASVVLQRFVYSHQIISHSRLKRS